MIDFLASAATTAVIIAALVVVVIIVLLFVLRGIKIAKPDEAIIVTSKQKKNDTSVQSSQRVVVGSRVFVKPFVESYSKLSLASRQLNVTSTAQTKNFVTIEVNAVAVVKVGGDLEMVRTAAQRFLNQQNEIERATEEVLAGSTRAIIGELTVEEIITNRAEFQTRAFDAVKEALDIQGLQIDTLQIKEISDRNEYINNLSRAEQARVRQQAELAETEMQRNTDAANIEAQQAIAEKQRELDLRIAAISAETDQAKAKAQQAAPLAKALAEQEVIDAEAAAAERRVELTRKRIESEVNAVADGEAYKTRVAAEAAQQALSAKAKGDVAVAQADRDARLAKADATKAEGDAEAHAILARGRAEAEATKAKTDALEENAAALLQQQIIALLPEIIEAAAKPLAAISSMTVISSDGGGAEQVGRNVAGQLATTTQIVKDVTGIDISDLVNSSVSGAAAGRALAADHPSHVDAAADAVVTAAGSRAAKRQAASAPSDGVQPDGLPAAGAESAAAPGSYEGQPPTA